MGKRPSWRVAGKGACAFREKAALRKRRKIVAHRDGRPNSGCKSRRGGREARAACVYRLDARVGLRPDVSDALLQRVAYSAGADDGILPVVASGWNVAGAAIYFSGGRFVRDGDAAAARERRGTQRDCANGNFARGRDFWVGTAVSRPGIHLGLSEVAVDGFAARGCAEHLGDVDYVDL